jgi:hypothetical protein
VAVELDANGLPVLRGKEDADADHTATEHWDLIEALKIVIKEVEAIKAKVGI